VMAEEGQRLEPGRVCVGPPDRHLLVEHGSCSKLPGHTSVAPHMPASSPEAERGPQIELVGELMRLVELGLDGKRAALSADELCSVKVVAGAYDHREFALPPVPYELGLSEPP
jgi:hypothetical protein